MNFKDAGSFYLLFFILCRIRAFILFIVMLSSRASRSFYEGKHGFSRGRVTVTLLITRRIYYFIAFIIITGL